MVKEPASTGDGPYVSGQLPHPVFGFMKGMLVNAPEFDPTTPVCPNWESYAEQKYGPDSELGKLLAAAVDQSKRDCSQ